MEFCAPAASHDGNGLAKNLEAPFIHEWPGGTMNIDTSDIFEGVGRVMVFFQVLINRKYSTYVFMAAMGVFVEAFGHYWKLFLGNFFSCHCCATFEVGSDITF